MICSAPDNFMGPSDFLTDDSTFPTSREAIVGIVRFAVRRPTADQDSLTDKLSHAVQVRMIEETTCLSRVSDQSRLPTRTVSGPGVSQVDRSHQPPRKTNGEQGAIRSSRSPSATTRFKSASEGFTANLRGPTAVPGCGRHRLCWEGGLASVLDMLKSGATDHKGLVDPHRWPPTAVLQRSGASCSRSDDNLVEFMCYRRGGRSARSRQPTPGATPAPSLRGKSVGAV